MVDATPSVEFLELPEPALALNPIERKKGVYGAAFLRKVIRDIQQVRVGAWGGAVPPEGKGTSAAAGAVFVRMQHCPVSPWQIYKDKMTADRVDDAVGPLTLSCARNEGVA